MAPKEITTANTARRSCRSLKEPALDERPQKPEENTKSLEVAFHKGEYGDLRDEKIDRLEEAVKYLQTEVSRLGRQAQRYELVDENNAPSAKTYDAQTLIEIERYKAKFQALEAAKQKAEKEKTEAGSIASKLRQKLDEKRKALEGEKDQCEAKGLEIELLRDLTLQQEQHLLKTEKALRESQERCKQLEAHILTDQQQSLGQEHIGSGSGIKHINELGEITTSKEAKVQTREEWLSALQDGHQTPNKKRRHSSLQSDKEPNVLAQHMSKLASLADDFLVVDDGNLDLNMAASFMSKIGQERSYTQLQTFCEHGRPNHWFCLQDVLEKGLYAYGMIVNKCSQHEGLPCLLVMVTMVDSVRHLTLSYTRSAMADC
ncbi:hypothetical protein FHETE_2996 [Fusarium heterosporum]|uniref:Uncharacterized protein n=1 Tax=Fusarium heterosporum TaxID=42747 RepID=A0A8H5WXS0_FUSHE|nr:hypothetical protein FHETE_2996 [Fusarium heterosporum]